MNVTHIVSQRRSRPTVDGTCKARHTPADKTVLLVHGDPSTRAAVERTLQRGGVRTAAAANAQEALAKLECLGAVAIGVVVSDYALDDTNGIDLLRAVRLGWPRIARILLVPHETDLPTAARAVKEAQIARLVLSPCQPDNLLAEARELLQGADQDVAPAGSSEAHTGQRPSADHAAAGQARLGRLTAREREVLACLGRGATNAEIAEQLHLTLGSARVYVKRVLSKLGLRDRTKAALEARTLGFGLGADRG